MLTLTLFSVLTRCLGFLYKIYLTRIMTTNELGVYNLSISFYMVLITIVGSSIPLTISKITSTNLKSKKYKETSYYVTSSIIIAVISSLILSILLVISKPLISLIIGSELGYQILLSLIPSIIFTAMYSGVRGYLWGKENYFHVSMVEFIEQILRILCCMIFVTIGIFYSNVLAVGLSLSIACAISTIYGYLIYFKNGGKFNFQKGYTKDILKSSLPLTAVRLFSSVLQPFVAILLPILLCKYGMTRNEAISDLGIIMGMTAPLLSIPSTIIGALSMILIPRINKSQYNSNDNQKQITNYIQFTISTLFLFVPILVSLGIPMCQLVFDSIDAGKYLSLASWTTIPMGLSQITTSILNAMNQEHKSFIYYIISSIMLIVSLLILPKFCGIVSMLYASGISSILLFILNYNKIKRLTTAKYQIISQLSKHIIISIPLTILGYLLYNVLVLIMSRILSIALTSIILSILYIAVLIVFKVIKIEQIKLITNKLRKKYS